MSLNTLELEQKMLYMESKNIPNYRVSFGPRSIVQGRNIREILFTSDGKYSFVCKVYIGKNKEDFIDACTNYAVFDRFLKIYNLKTKCEECPHYDEYHLSIELRNWFARNPECYYYIKFSENYEDDYID